MAEKKAVERESVPPEVYPRLVEAMMRRQAGLSLRVAAVFLLMLLLLPLVNYFWPELAMARIGGFTATWLFLGVLFYPVTWILSWYFIKASDRIEHECADWKNLGSCGPELQSEGSKVAGSETR